MSSKRMSAKAVKDLIAQINHGNSGGATGPQEGWALSFGLSKYMRGTRDTLRAHPIKNGRLAPPIGEAGNGERPGLDTILRDFPVLAGAVLGHDGTSGIVAAVNMKGQKMNAGRIAVPEYMNRAGKADTPAPKATKAAPKTPRKTRRSRARS